MNWRFATKEVKNQIVCGVYWAAEKARSWEPQPTCREVVRLTLIETALALVFIGIFEPQAIF